VEESIFSNASIYRGAKPAWRAHEMKLGKWLLDSTTLDLLMIGLFVTAYPGIEGVPGVAKNFNRKAGWRKNNWCGIFPGIQFTPDPTPSDVVGTPF